MNVEEIDLLIERSAAWRLLRARNAPLILSFLGKVFVEDNTGALPAQRLVAELEDHLHEVGQLVGEERYPGGAAGYLETWAAPDSGWLRRFYPPQSEEVHYDATPALEKAHAWVASLRSRSFVGTESRLNTLVDLLRQMVHGSEGDPEVRLDELRRRRDRLDAEIAAVEAGQVDVLDGAALRDRFQLFSSSARELLSDFREVEENFRNLDRAARERIAGWEGSKGELLQDLVGDRTDITHSDQGRSFQTFYDFLLSQARQDELTELLAAVAGMDELDIDGRIRTVHHDWFDAAERTQQTVRQLSEQLRRFLDDQVWLENRRVMDLVRSIETTAIAVRDTPPRDGLVLDGTGVELVLPFERPLYDARPAAEIDSDLGEVVPEELDASVLFEQTFVDQVRLADNIRAVVPAHSTARLADILELYPVEEGIAEVVGYLALTDEDLDVVTDETSREVIPYTDGDGRPRAVRLGEVTVHRR